MAALRKATRSIAQAPFHPPNATLSGKGHRAWEPETFIPTSRRRKPEADLFHHYWVPSGFVAGPRAAESILAGEAPGLELFPTAEGDLQLALAREAIDVLTAETTFHGVHENDVARPAFFEDRVRRSSLFTARQAGSRFPTLLLAASDERLRHVPFVDRVIRGDLIGYKAFAVWRSDTGPLEFIPYPTT